MKTINIITTIILLGLSYVLPIILLDRLSHYHVWLPLLLLSIYIGLHFAYKYVYISNLNKTLRNDTHLRLPEMRIISIILTIGFSLIMIVYLSIVISSTINQNIEDNESPIFQNTLDNITIIEGERFDLLSTDLMAIDEVEGILTDAIEVNIQDTSILPIGEYTLRYTVSDSSLNTTVYETELSVIKDIFDYDLDSYRNAIVLNGLDSDQTITDLVIPSNINGIPIEEIQSFAFANSNLQRVTIPASIQVWGEYAFANNQISEVLLEEGLFKIGEGAFAQNQITELNLPNSLVIIDPEAFMDNAIEDIHFGNSIRFIMNYAFKNNQLTDLVIPYTVHYLHVGVFENNQLTAITLHGNIEFIGALCFARNQLTEVVIPYGIELIGSESFKDNNLTTVLIPDSVSQIEHQAFMNNYLTSVVIPNSVETMYFEAFMNNELTSVILSENLTTIEHGMFENNQLNEITIPNSVTSIGSNAFYNNNISTVYLSDNQDFLGTSAFTGNPIESFVASENNLYYSTIDGVLFSKDGSTLLRYPEFKKNSSYTVPITTTSIGRYSFENTQLTSIVITPNVEVIMARAFAFSSIQEVTIGSGVTSIGDGAFGSLQIYSLTILGDADRFDTDWDDIGFPDKTHPTLWNVPQDITIPLGHNLDFSQYDTIATDLTDGIITDDIIYSITDTTVLEVGEHQVSISITNSNGNTTEDTFTITVIEDIFLYTIIDNEITIHGLKVDGVTEIVIPNSLLGYRVTNIAESAFQSNGITSVVIPGNVSTIGADAFADNPIVAIEIIEYFRNRPSSTRFNYIWEEIGFPIELMPEYVVTHDPF